MTDSRSVQAQYSSWPSWLDWVPTGLDNWDAWVAIGTLGLAIVTWRLVARTKSDVRAATRSAEASEAALAAAQRPLLVEVPRGQFVKTGEFNGQDVDLADIEADVWDERELLIEVPLRNAGAGIALVGAPHLAIDTGPLTWKGVCLHTVVPSGELTRLDFKGSWPDHATTQEATAAIGADGATFTVSVPYTDVEGRQGTTTRVTTRRRVTEERDDWIVESVEFLRAGETTPFVTLTARSEGGALRP